MLKLFSVTYNDNEEITLVIATSKEEAIAKLREDIIAKVDIEMLDLFFANVTAEELKFKKNGCCTTSFYIGL